MADITRKQGDTLLAYLVVRDVATKVAVDLDALGIAVTSSAKDADGILHHVSVTSAQFRGEPAKRLSADTSDWPIGLLGFDAQLEKGDERTSTDTKTIQIVEDVTA